MTNKWYSIADKETWSLIYLVNFIFDIHDIFVGSFIAERLVRSARYILMQMLEGRANQLNQEQSYEINSLLGCEALKGSKLHLSFESDTKEIKDKLSDSSLAAKIEGLKLLSDIFGKCYNLQDQLNIFATKCHPLFKTLFNGINPSNIQTDPLFQEFLSLIKLITSQIIFDTQLYVQMDDEDDINDGEPTYTQEFEVEVLGNILAETQGLYPVLATIINFFM